MEKRGLAYYIEYGEQRIREWTGQARERVEHLAQSMSSFVQGAARAMRSGLQTSAGDGFDGLPAIDQSPRQQQAPALDHGQDERDRQRQRQRGHDRDEPDIGFGR